MGYLNVQEASSFFLGVPAGVQTQFLIEPAMNRVLPSAEPMLLKYLEALNGIECQLLEDQANLAATKIGNIEINLDEYERLMRQYKFWQGQLANLLGIPPNPFDMRPGFGPGASGINVPVVS